MAASRASATVGMTGLTVAGGRAGSQAGGLHPSGNPRRAAPAGGKDSSWDRYQFLVQARAIGVGVGDQVLAVMIVVWLVYSIRDDDRPGGWAGDRAGEVESSVNQVSAPNSKNNVTKLVDERAKI